MGAGVGMLRQDTSHKTQVTRHKGQKTRHTGTCRTDPLARAVAFTMRRNGPPMPWGYRILAIFLAVLFIGWLVMVVW